MSAHAQPAGESVSPGAAPPPPVDAPPAPVPAEPMTPPAPAGSAGRSGRARAARSHLRCRPIAGDRRATRAVAARSRRARAARTDALPPVPLGVAPPGRRRRAARTRGAARCPPRPPTAPPAPPRPPELPPCAAGAAPASHATGPATATGAAARAARWRRRVAHACVVTPCVNPAWSANWAKFQKLGLQVFLSCAPPWTIHSLVMFQAALRITAYRSAIAAIGANFRRSTGKEDQLQIGLGSAPPFGNS